MNRRLLDYLPEMEFLDEGEAPERTTQPRQAATMTFGADLLDLPDGAPLGAFLRKLVASIAAADRVPVGAALGKALVAVLEPVARSIMPIRRSGTGGADLKTMASRVFGMELEGLSPEDKEYEVAQQFIRLAADTIRNASAAAHTGAPSVVTAVAAFRQAARRYAPGLLKSKAQHAPTSGRWHREAGHIIVLHC